MSRIVVRGGRIFDGTGADPADGDVAIEDGRIVDVGTGLDGDEAVDVAGPDVLPGLFDCHTHVTLEPRRHVVEVAQTPFSYQFYVAAAEPGARRCGSGSRPSATRAARTSASSRRSRTA